MTSTKTSTTLRNLKSLGVRISMDDFGTGYSSLGSLRSFPFDKIKIDRSFVSDLERSQDAAAIVPHAVLELGHSLAWRRAPRGWNARAVGVPARRGMYRSARLLLQQAQAAG